METESQLSTWLHSYHQAVSSVGQAVEGLTQHLKRLPDPASKEDVRDLLAWRESQFRFDDSPAPQDTRERAAASVARFLEDARRRVEGALAKMLENIEQSLSFAAKDNVNGVFAPDLLPPEAVRVIGGGCQLVNRRALPEGHPLHQIPESSRFAWVFLCQADVGFRMDGTPIHLLPPWCTIASVRRVAAEQAAEAAKQDRIERERRERQQAEQEQRERLARLEWTDEQRIAQLENELAALRR